MFRVSRKGIHYIIVLVKIQEVPLHSHLLHQVFVNIDCEIMMSGVCGVFLLHLAKAFDTILCDILLIKVQKLGFRTSTKN